MTEMKSGPRKICPSCGASIRKSANFCGYCGAAQPEENEVMNAEVSPAVNEAVSEPVSEEASPASSGTVSAETSPAVSAAVKTETAPKADGSVRSAAKAAAGTFSQAASNSKATAAAFGFAKATASKFAAATSKATQFAADKLAAVKNSGAGVDLNPDGTPRAVIKDKKSEEFTDNSNIYIIEFFKHMLRSSNIPMIAYLLMNIIFVIVVVYVFMDFLLSGDFSVGEAILIGFLLYLISITIALSPIGELMLRFQNQCKEIKALDEQERINPIFREVYDKAKEANPNLPDDIKIYNNPDGSPNAFATGRKTVCVTRGLLTMPDSQIRATLGHEFGHLSHHDTDSILLVAVGNFFVNAIIIAIRIIIPVVAYGFALLTRIIGIFLGPLGSVLADISAWFTEKAGDLAFWLVGLFQKLWMWIGTMMLMKSSRGNEFEADEFAYNLGYGRALCELFNNLDDGEIETGLFAALAASHPPIPDRIARLQQLGVDYNRYASANTAANTSANTAADTAANGEDAE